METTLCPVCDVLLTNTPDEEGQITCQQCGGYFPLKWAKSVREYHERLEERRKERSDLEGEVDEPPDFQSGN